MIPRYPHILKYRPTFSNTCQKRLSLHSKLIMEQKKSPIRYGAERGQWFGLYLSAIFLGMVHSGHLPLLGLISAILLLGLPVVFYWFIRKYAPQAGSISLSTLTLMGLTMTICGCIICSVVTMVYLSWINPAFIIDTVKGAVQFYASLGTPEAMKLARGYNQMIEQGLIPNATAFTTTMATCTVMLGSLLSVVCSALALYRHKRSVTPGRPTPFANPEKPQY